MFMPVSVWSGIYSGLCRGTQVTNVSPSGLSLGGIPQGYSECALVASEASKALKVRSWMSVRYAIRSFLGASPSRLSGRTRRGKYGACVGKGQSPAREGKLWCKICLQPRLEQGGTALVERWCWSLFSSCRWELTIPASLL